VAVAILWLIALFRRRAAPIVRSWRDRRAFAAMLGGTVAGPVVGIWLSMVAIQLARVGIASTLMALPPIFVIPLEYAFQRTPVSARSLAGTVVALGGVALILLP
jgi:drug/metabolite transporter (DMT)-like permease